jgi:hypothetical protein
MKAVNLVDLQHPDSLNIPLLLSEPDDFRSQLQLDFRQNSISSSYQQHGLIMSTNSRKSSPPLDMVGDLESRNSSDIYEEHTLLEQKQSIRPRSSYLMPKWLRAISGPTYVLICSAFFLAAAIVVWARVYSQLKHFQCDFGQQEFEPDCEFFPILTADLRVTTSSAIFESCHIPAS